MSSGVPLLTEAMFPVNAGSVLRSLLEVEDKSVIACCVRVNGDSANGKWLAEGRMLWFHRDTSYGIFPSYLHHCAILPEFRL
jgi:hypothetical protein